MLRVWQFAHNAQWQMSANRLAENIITETIYLCWSLALEEFLDQAFLLLISFQLYFLGKY
jgi:hypothetical protein